MKMQIGLSTDNDGFLSQECPSCERVFKIRPGEGAEGTIGHCPYCQHDGEDCWLTKEQVEYVKAVTFPRVSRMVDDMLADAFRNTKSIKFTPSRSHRDSSVPSSSPVESDETMPVHVFSSGEEIKHDSRNVTLRCPVTGVEERVR